MSKLHVETMEIEEFMRELSSKAPVPGGGGVAGVTGALASSLGCMVINLTSGKKKFAEYEDEYAELLKKLTGLTADLLAAADKDAEVFEPLSEAYGMKADTEEEKAHKEEVMEKALTAAAEAPIAMMELLRDTLVILDRLSVIGSKLVLSDAGVGAALASAAAKSAILNVFINTKMLKDRKLAENYNKKALILLKECDKIMEKAFGTVWGYLKPEEID